MSVAIPSLRGAIAVPEWAKNELWRKARTVPSLDLRFAESKSLVDATTGTNLIDFTRASSGTYVGSDGLIKTATTNEARFDHDPTTGESLGLLVEESRINRFQWSNSAVNGETWNNVGALFNLQTGATDPAGGTNAFIASDATNTTSGSFLQRTSIDASLPANTVVTYSVWFKPISTPNDVVILNLFANGITDSLAATFESVNGVLSFGSSSTSGTGVVTNAYPIPYPNGWYRLVLTGIPSTTAGSDMRARINLGSYQQVQGTHRFYWYGAQLETGLASSPAAPFATSYIPTIGSTVTRAADVPTDTTRGAAIRSLYAQFRSPASGTRPVVSLDDDTANERIELFTSGTDPKLLVTDGGSTQADLDAGSITANTTARLAARFNTDNFAASVSGGAEVADTTGTMPTVNRVRIGRDQAGNCLNGTIARITGWDSPLPLLPTITQ